MHALPCSSAIDCYGRGRRVKATCYRVIVLMYYKVATASMLAALVEVSEVFYRQTRHAGWRLPRGLMEMAREIFEMIPDLSFACFYGC